jgi:hypothetical protein
VEITTIMMMIIIITIIIIIITTTTVSAIPSAYIFIMTSYLYLVSYFSCCFFTSTIFSVFSRCHITFGFCLVKLLKGMTHEISYMQLLFFSFPLPHNPCPTTEVKYAYIKDTLDGILRI